MLTLIAFLSMPIGLSAIVQFLPGAKGETSEYARMQRMQFEKSKGYQG